MLNEELARLTSKAENRMVPLLLFAGLALVSVVFASTVLFRMVSVSEKVSAELGNILADDMLHNEDLADVISLLYFRLNNTRQLFSAPAMEYDAQHKIYGFNLSVDTTSSAFQGTLQSRHPLSRKAILIARSVDTALGHEGQVPHRHLVIRRYFLPINNDYVYLYSKMPISLYAFASYGGQGFDLEAEGKRHNYFTQIGSATANCRSR